MGMYFDELPSVSSDNTERKSKSSTSSIDSDKIPSILMMDNVPDIIKKEPLEQEFYFKNLPRNVCPSTCAVCGQSSTGYHYEVPSCNGCKTFFRRTIITNRKFVCKGDNTCFDEWKEEISSRPCRACRFAKCVAVGMNAKAIQRSDESSTAVVPVKRSFDDNISEPSTSKVMVPLSCIEGQITDVIDGLMYLEIKVETFRYADKRNLNFWDDTIERLLSKNVDFSTDKEVDVAKYFKPPKSDKGCSKLRKPWFHMELSTTVEYAKTFMFLHKMDMKDRVILVRYVLLMCWNLTHAYDSFKRKSNLLINIDGDLAGPPQHKSDSISTKHRQDIQVVLCAMIRNNLDKCEYIIFKAIILCNPAVPNLSEHAQKLLTTEREKYSKALFNYCMKQHGPANGPARFSMILSLADLLESQQKNQKDFHLLLTILHPHCPMDNFLTDVFS